MIGIWFAWLQFVTDERGRQVIQRFADIDDIQWPAAEFKLRIDILIFLLAATSTISIFAGVFWK